MENKDSTSPYYDELQDQINTSVPNLEYSSVEQMVEQSIGTLNSTQIIQALLASLPPFFDSQQTFISIFAHAQPTWHCTHQSTTPNTCIPNKSDICSLPRNDWAWDSGTRMPTSIISEWNLQCATSFITGFPSTSYFVGCLIGGLILSTLGDSSLGRKNLLCISSLVMSLSALASAFSPNLWVYSGFRFISGAGRAPLAICTLVLLTERVGKRWRAQVAMIGFTHFSLGILALTTIAYLIRGSSWRNLYLWTSIPGIICSIICFFSLFESPRWLFMQGRHKESIWVLSKLGQSNQDYLTSPLIPKPQLNNKNNNKNNNNASPLASLKILIKKKWAIKRLLAAVILSFGIGLIYFGMFLGVGNLGFNIHLTSTFSALISLVSYILTFLFWIPRCNRRSSLLGFCAISGATSIVLSILGKEYKGLMIGLELISLFCACMAYNLVLMYTVELFPTCVRNSASSLVRQAMIFGSVFDPVLILLGRENMLYCYGVFGITVLVCGFLVVCLPETKGKVLCDTMEEQEFLGSCNNKEILV